MPHRLKSGLYDDLRCTDCGDSLKDKLANLYDVQVASLDYNFDLDGQEGIHVKCPDCARMLAVIPDAVDITTPYAVIQNGSTTETWFNLPGGYVLVFCHRGGHSPQWGIGWNTKQQAISNLNELLDEGAELVKGTVADEYDGDYCHACGRFHYGTEKCEHCDFKYCPDCFPVHVQALYYCDGGKKDE